MYETDYGTTVITVRALFRSVHERHGEIVYAETVVAEGGPAKEFSHCSLHGPEAAARRERAAAEAVVEAAAIDALDTPSDTDAGGADAGAADAGQGHDAHAHASAVDDQDAMASPPPPVTSPAYQLLQMSIDAGDVDEAYVPADADHFDLDSALDQSLQQHAGGTSLSEGRGLYDELGLLLDPEPTSPAQPPAPAAQSAGTWTVESSEVAAPAPVRPMQDNLMQALLRRLPAAERGLSDGDAARAAAPAAAEGGSLPPGISRSASAASGAAAEAGAPARAVVPAAPVAVDSAGRELPSSFDSFEDLLKHGALALLCVRHQRATAIVSVHSISAVHVL